MFILRDLGDFVDAIFLTIFKLVNLLGICFFNQLINFNQFFNQRYFVFDIICNTALIVPSTPRALFLFTEWVAIWGFTGIYGRKSDIKGAADPKSEGEKQALDAGHSFFWARSSYFQKSDKNLSPGAQGALIVFKLRWTQRNLVEN